LQDGHCNHHFSHATSPVPHFHYVLLLAELTCCSESLTGGGLVLALCYPDP
jgi:hypothetical protein